MICSFLSFFSRSDTNEVGDEILQVALGRSILSDDRSGVFRRSKKIFAKDDCSARSILNSMRMPANFRRVAKDHSSGAVRNMEECAPEYYGKE